MNPNSQAYRDAWARVRAAIKAELDEREIVVGDDALDDMACNAVYAAFGVGEDNENSGS